jgi:hypothetical protein
MKASRWSRHNGDTRLQVGAGAAVTAVRPLQYDA